MSGPGYIRVNRRIWEHPLFLDEPFTRREAWLWLISEAAWREERVRIKRRMVTIQRGQVAHSIRFMAGAWGWSLPKAQRFLDLLIAEGMLVRTADTVSDTETDTVSDTKQTILTICNYEHFQKGASKNDTETDTVSDTGSDTNLKKEETNAVSKETLARARARGILISDFKKVFVALHTPQWSAWQEVKPTPCVFSVEHHANGWWFSSEWPGTEPGMDPPNRFMPP